MIRQRVVNHDTKGGILKLRLTQTSKLGQNITQMKI
jgi:hypothetical protein